MVSCVHSHRPQSWKSNSVQRRGALGDRLGQQRVLPKMAGDGRSGCLRWAGLVEAVPMVHGGVVSKMGVTLASCYAGCTSVFDGDGVAAGSGPFVYIMPSRH